MHKLPVLGGREVALLLTKRFGFIFVSQRGSHMKFRNDVTHRTTIIPDHKELANGTLKSILELAGIPLDEFLQTYHK